MKRPGNLIDSSDATNPTSSVYHRGSKVKKPFVGFVNARVSGKFNRKCFKLKLKEKLFERKNSSVMMENSSRKDMMNKSDSNASPLTQLANAFGGICTFGTPTSTKSFGGIFGSGEYNFFGYLFIIYSEMISVRVV